MTDEELIEVLRTYGSFPAWGQFGKAWTRQAADRLEALTQPSGKVSDEMVEQMSRKVMLNLFEAELEGDAESEWHRVADIVRAALEAAQLPARPVVKALEWEELNSPREDGPSDPTGDIEAQTLIGEYSVCFDDDEDVSATPWCAWSPVENIGHFDDFDEAKAAAQADYERRILSALEGEGQ